MKIAWRYYLNPVRTAIIQTNESWRTIWPSLPLLGIYPNDTKRAYKKTTYNYTYDSTFHSSEDPETILIPNEGWMDRETVNKVW